MNLPKKKLEKRFKTFSTWKKLESNHGWKIIYSYWWCWYKGYHNFHFAINWIWKISIFVLEVYEIIPFAFDWRRERIPILNFLAFLHQHLFLSKWKIHRSGVIRNLSHIAFQSKFTVKLAIAVILRY